MNREGKAAAQTGLAAAVELAPGEALDVSSRRARVPGHMKVAPAVALSLCFLALASGYLRLSHASPKGSDDACYVLQGQDILNGNVFLRGWTLPPDSFYTATTPLYVLCGLLTSHMSTSMYVIPPLVGALLMTICLAIIWSVVESEYRLVGALLFLAIAAFFPFVFPWDLTHSASHTPTILLVVTGFYFLSVDSYIPFAILALIAAEVGDGFADWIGIAPIMAIGLLHLAAGYRRLGAKLLAVAGASAIIAKLTLFALNHLGGFASVKYATTFASFESLPEKVSLYLRCLLMLFGADFFGRQAFALETGLILIHLAVLALVVWAILEALMETVRGTQSLLIMLLLASVIIDGATFVLSTLATDVLAVRWLAPVQVFGGLIVAMSWQRPPLKRGLIILSLPVLVVGCLVTFVRPMFHPSVPVEPGIVVFLERKGLTEGFGSYSEAGILTVLSDGKIKVRQVTASPGGKLERLGWVSAEQWYRGTDPRFLVFSRWAIGYVNEISAINTWGPPAQLWTVSGYTIMIWNSTLHLLGE
jgi:hypothetical protein